MTRRSITATAVVVVAVSTALQLGALLVRPDVLARGVAARRVFGTVELALVGVLIVVGWQMIRWTRATDQAPLTQRVARLCFASLLLCGLGDVVNRNYPEQYFQWDHVLRHSYLITAIWLFFPGYLLVIVANRVATRDAVPRRDAVRIGVIAALLGAGASFTNHLAHLSAYASVMILIYGMLLATLAGSALWLLRAFDWAASRVVVIGVLLAPVADALIGNFWIYRDHYPTIEHVNWIVYFASLAMIQRLPFLVADASPTAAPVDARVWVDTPRGNS